MPHKHTRKSEDKSTNDLPPTIVARPLPVTKSAKSNGIFTTELLTTRKRKRKVEKSDDTPKAFARLMSFREGKRLPKSLDDGLKITKKQRRSAAESASSRKESDFETPTINPGERMSDFAARVDAALPLSGLLIKTAKGGKDPLGLKVARTKKERKMHKMYDEWREQDRRIKEKRLESLEIAQDEEEDEELGVKWKVDMEATTTGSRSKKKGKGNKSKVIGEINDDDGDPWAAVAKARNEGPKRLNDVVQAPPQFSKLPMEKFKVRGVRANVEGIPKTSGSLRRREELMEVRKSVVEGYRQMMKDSRLLLDLSDRNRTTIIIIFKNCSQPKLDQL